MNEEYRIQYDDRQVYYKEKYKELIDSHLSLINPLKASSHAVVKRGYILQLVQDLQIKDDNQY